MTMLQADYDDFMRGDMNKLGYVTTTPDTLQKHLVSLKY